MHQSVIHMTVATITLLISMTGIVSLQLWLYFILSILCDFNWSHFILMKFSEYGAFYMSRVVRKPAFCIGENKDADQLRGNREADQRLCFRYIGSTIPLLPKFEISSLYPSSVAVQPSLCQTRLETRMLVFS